MVFIEVRSAVRVLRGYGAAVLGRPADADYFNNCGGARLRAAAEGGREERRAREPVAAIGGHGEAGEA
ncbi:hypothetical protein ACFQMF_02725 [Halorubrum rutilum]|uniref:Uncharacterized protein n=1 Tax=Halorubrum rutilum TaxID=1364933 RepID=A0ABD6AI02_9EURY|nr:hypothetical protein [Halorubrum rutilum]